MEKKELKGQYTIEKDGELKPDSDEIKKAAGVVQHFQSTFNLMKKYPLDNPGIKEAIISFTDRLKEFLGLYETFRIGIQEFSFSYQGEILFKDKMKKKSLPFFLFKDGMKELSFHEGMDEKETQDFLEVIKKDYDLPSDYADIVNSLWEKDFAHIRYLALDEFLDSDIGEGKEEKSIKVDKKRLALGTISLNDADQKEIFDKSQILKFYSGEGGGEGKGSKGEGTGVLDSVAEIPVLEEAELPKIESLIESNRQVSPLNELVILLLEILFLEERDEKFSDVLDVIEGCFKKVILRTDFSLALSILDQIQELKEILASKSAKKVKMLGRIPERATDGSSLTVLKQLFLDKKIEDVDSFFKYLGVLGAGTIPLVCDIWEITGDPYIRVKALDLLRKMGQKNIASLIGIARVKQAALTKEILSIVAKVGEKNEMYHLKEFVDHSKKEIRLEVIRALAGVRDEAANKILLEFLSDSDTNNRIIAASELTYYGDQGSLDHVMQLVRNKDFMKKGREEKKYLFEFLASTKSPKASDLFQFFLKRKSFFSRARQNEIRLLAVSALKAMATPEAKKALEKGTKIRNKTIRQACFSSLKKIEQKAERKEVNKSEQDG
jgi:HEAT repeat protein